jgi:hypothetical protein
MNSYFFLLKPNKCELTCGKHFECHLLNCINNCWELTQNLESEICQNWDTIWRNRAMILGAVSGVLLRKKLGHNLRKSGHDFTSKEKNKNVFSTLYLFLILRVLFLYKFSRSSRKTGFRSQQQTRVYRVFS